MSDVKNSGLATGLVSYWELEEASGDKIDSHGSNDLAPIGTINNIAAVQGNGADFTGSQRATISDASQTGLDLTGDFTMAFWIYPDTVTSDSIVSKWASSGQFAYSFGWLDAGTGGFAVFLSGNGSSVVGKVVNASASFSTGSWQHVAIVYDASAGSVTAYRNASAGSAVTGFPTSIFNSNAEFQLGYWVSGSFLDGKLDEFGIWNRTLSGAEISDLYNSGAGIPYDAGGAGGYRFNPQIRPFAGL